MAGLEHGLAAAFDSARLARAAAAIALLGLAAGARGGDDGEDGTASLTPSSTSLAEMSPAATHPRGTASPTTPPSLTPVTVFPGEQRNVLVYSDFEARVDECAEALATMVPSSVFGSEIGKPVPCTIGEADAFNFRYLATKEGTLVVDAVRVILLGASTPPEDTPPDTSCGQLAQHVLPATADPAERLSVFACELKPLPRAKEVEVTHVWGAISSASQQANLSPDIPCWQLAQYLGAPRGATPIPTRCLLEELPR